SSFLYVYVFFFFSSRRRHTRSKRDWSSDVCSSDLWRSDLKNPSGGFQSLGPRALQSLVMYAYCHCARPQAHAPSGFTLNKPLSFHPVSPTELIITRLTV